MSNRYNNNNMNQQQINDSFNMKCQHLIDGQQKILDIQHSMPSTVTRNVIAYISNCTVIPVSSSDIQPPPKRQIQMLLTPSLSNHSCVPSQLATSDIQLDLKHVQIQSAIVDYYGMQQFNCIASIDTGKTTTKSTQMKLKRLINSIHYLAKDDANVLAW
jgi:hypothetical protein